MKFAEAIKSPITVLTGDSSGNVSLNEARIGTAVWTLVGVIGGSIWARKRVADNKEPIFGIIG